MRKIYFLLATVSFGIFVLAGCGGAAGNTNKATNTNTAGKANTAVTKTDEPAKSVLKAADASPDKPVKVSELVDGVAADKDGFKGKEVAVTGYVSGTSGTAPHLLLTIFDEATATNKKNVACTFTGKDDEVFGKTVTVKGKISSSSTDGETKMVTLDPCELKK